MKSRLVFRSVLLFLVFLTIVFVFSATTFAAKQETVVLKWSDMSPPTGLRPQFLQKAAEEVEKATEGRVKIQFYWSNSLVHVKENVRAVQSGIADMAWTMPIYNPSEYPLGTVSQTVLSAPHGGDAGYIVRAFWDLWDECKPLRDEVEKWGVTAWYLMPYGGYGCYAKKPITTLEDINGMRLRVSSEGIGKMVAAVGASPQFLAASEVYTALDRGMFDGAVVGYEWGKRYRFYEVTSYLNQWDSCMIAVAYGIVSKAALNKMSDQDRKKFMDIGRRVSIEYGDALRRSKESDIQLMIDKGMTLVPFPEKEKKRWAMLPKIKALIPEWLEKQEKAGRGKEAKEVMEAFLKKFQIGHLMPK